MMSRCGQVVTPMSCQGLAKVWKKKLSPHCLGTSLGKLQVLSISSLVLLFVQQDRNVMMLLFDFWFTKYGKQAQSSDKYDSRWC